MRVRHTLTVTLAALVAWGTGCASSLNQLRTSVEFGARHDTPMRVAVANLENDAKEPRSDGATSWTPVDSAGRRMADVIATKLTGFPEYQVIERSRLDKVLSELELQQSDLMDPDSLRRIGKLVGTEAMIVGRVEAWHGTNMWGWLDNVTTGFRMVDVQTGEVLWSADGYVVRTHSSDDLFSAIADDLFPRLRGELDAANSAGPEEDAGTAEDGESDDDVASDAS